MEIYCEHGIDSDYDDDKLLLDDENTNTASCERCCRNSYTYIANGLIKPTDTSMLIGYRSNLDSTVINDFDDMTFHCHSKELPLEDQRALKKLVLVSCLCFFFMVTELVGGYIAGSLAVMTDAAHLFSDLIGFFVSILAIWIGRKPPTTTMSFGYHRAEVLGAFISVLVVWLLAGIFSFLAIGRLVKKGYEIDANTMLIVASIGVIVNILMGAVLHGMCHVHSHALKEPHSENINVRAAAAHVLGDLLQSVGVLLAAVIIKLFPGAKLADPICTLLFSVIVVYATVAVARDALKILVEASPMHASNLRVLLMGVPDVKHVHEVHVWSLSPGKNAVAVHLAVDQFCDRDVVLKQATGIIKSHLGVISCTVQIEAYNELLIGSCLQCQA